MLSVKLIHGVCVVLDDFGVFYACELTHTWFPKEDRQDSLGAIPTFVSLVCQDLPLSGTWHDSLKAQMPLYDQSFGVEIAGCHRVSFCHSNRLQNVA